MSGDPNNNEVFSTLEIDTIGEIMNISMGSAATAASTLLDNKVTITTPVVNVLPVSEFTFEHLEPAVSVEIQYVEGISGSNVLILKKSDMRLILSQMMMTELPEDYEIDEMAESAICELMNQMMGSSATVLSCFLGRTINISTPATVPIGGIDDFKERYFDGEENLLSIQFTLTIKDTIESVFLCAMKIELAKEIIGVSLNFEDPTVEETPVAQQAEETSDSEAAAQDQVPPAPTAAGQPPAAPVAAQQVPPSPPAAGPGPAAPAQPYPGYEQPAPAPGAQPYAAPPMAPQYAQPYQQPYAPPPQYAPAGYEQQPVAVKEYNYGDFSAGAAGGAEGPVNLDLVMNVPVTMTVELGRTKRKIKEILEFGQGTIVELDKQAGSQVDVIVNGQMIARGDVVVVDDNFSIRITEIVKNKDPLSML